MSDTKKIKNFTDLYAWQQGHALVLLIYRYTKKFPKEEIYALTSQIHRAAISVTSNIAEGFGRQTCKEKIQFYYLSQGSLTEVKNQLIISRDVGYVDQDAFLELMAQADVAHQLLQGLITKTKTFL